jgi:hypothetical protein
MSDRRNNKPKQQNTFAASALLVVLAGICTAPALAATSTRIDCPEEATRATLDVTSDILTAELVSHSNPAEPNADEQAIANIDAGETASPASLLAPRAAAAIREAFKLPHTPPMAGTDAKPESATDDESTVPDSGMNTELPGVSDEDFARYKKQMYRRDI